MKEGVIKMKAKGLFICVVAVLAVIACAMPAYAVYERFGEDGQTTTGTQSGFSFSGNTIVDNNIQYGYFYGGGLTLASNGSIFGFRNGLGSSVTFAVNDYIDLVVKNASSGSHWTAEVNGTYASYLTFQGYGPSDLAAYTMALWKVNTQFVLTAGEDTITEPFGDSNLYFALSGAVSPSNPFLDGAVASFTDGQVYNNTGFIAHEAGGAPSGGVPEPATVLSLITLAGLAWRRRRK